MRRQVAAALAIFVTEALANYNVLNYNVLDWEADVP